MKTIIVGAGIAGLSAAIALEKAGIQCEVYEAAPELREVGAGIWMAPNAMQVFDRLGFAGEVAGAGFPLGRGAVTDQNGKAISTMDMAALAAEFGQPATAIHRGRLQSILLAQLRPDQVHTGKRLLDFEETEHGVIARFEDGSRAEGDILLGADGIHSAVRAHLMPDSQLRYSGQTCWRGIADLNLDREGVTESREMWGGSHRFGYSSVSADEVYWFAVALAPEGGKDDPGTLLRRLKEGFGGFAEPVPTILERTPAERIIRGDISDLKPLASWHKGRILLLGDAAHATTPNLGQGGCQAVEDAWVLHLLMKNNPDWQTAFPAFEAKRRKKVDGIVRNSRRMGKLAHWRRGKGLRNWLLRQTPDAVMRKSMRRLYAIAE